MTYRDKLEARIAKTGSNLCVGLDPRAEKINANIPEFVRSVIEETKEFTAAYKPNIAYFEAMGIDGMELLMSMREWIPEEIPVILDAKRGDIGETQKYYAKACFEVWGGDAVTLSPYLGAETLDPFLDYQDKGIYLLGVTSNEGARDLQLQKTVNGQYIFELVQQMCGRSPQIGLVAGLTNAIPDILLRMADVPLLIPGLGAQGGDLKALEGQQRRAPILVNVSRGVMFPGPESTPRQMAQKYSEEIRLALKGNNPN